MAVDGAIRYLDVELIGGAHDLLAAEDKGWPRQKGPENSELDRRQTQRRARELGDMLLRIDGQPALRQRCRGRSGLLAAHRDAAQDDVHPRNQLAWAERLGDIVVAADFEAED